MTFFTKIGCINNNNNSLRLLLLLKGLSWGNGRRVSWLYHWRDLRLLPPTSRHSRRGICWSGRRTSLYVWWWTYYIVRRKLQYSTPRCNKIIFSEENQIRSTIYKTHLELGKVVADKRLHMMEVDLPDRVA